MGASLLPRRVVVGKITRGNKNGNCQNLIKQFIFCNICVIYLVFANCDII